MTEPKARRTASTPVPETSLRTPEGGEVRAFLEAHPEFITENPDVLNSLAPQREQGGEQVVDLQAFLIDRLRRENERLSTEYAELVETSRANLTSQARIHKATLRLLEARTFADLIETVTTDLAVRLNVDVVKLAVENLNGVAEHSVRGIRLLTPGSIENLFSGRQDVLLLPDAMPERAVYGSAIGLVKSEALLRLHASPDSPPGVLALGSRYAGHFDPGQGTELLSHLSRVLELCIRTWLGLPKS